MNQNDLTFQEQYIAILVSYGQTRKDIAKELSMSVKTVPVHMTNIYNKLGFRNIALLTRYVLEEKVEESFTLNSIREGIPVSFLEIGG